MSRSLWRIALCSFLVCTLSAHAEIPRPASEQDTLHALAEALESLDDILRVDIDAADRSVTYYTQKDGQEVKAGQSFIDNIHPLMRSAQTDTERQVTMDGFVQSIAANLQGQPDLDKTQILPVIRNKDFSNGLSGTAPVSRPFLADMRVFYVQDLPTQINYINDDHLLDLGLSLDALHGLALENAAQRRWQPRFEGDGIYVPVLDGNFEASLLLLPDLWADIDADLGTIGAIVAARDVIIFGDIEQPGLLDAMKNIVARNEGQLSYAISVTPIQWTGTDWAEIK